MKMSGFPALTSLAFLIAASPVTPSVDDLVARHVSALGGIDRIHAIRSFIKHGWYQEGDFHTDALTAQMRPFYRVIGDPRVSGARDDYEGYDGSAWEYYFGSGHRYSHRRAGRAYDAA